MPRKGGLGPRGADALNRIQEGMSNAGAAPNGQRYEDVMFGSGRPGGPAQPNSEWKYPSSSRVHAYMYDYNNQILHVRFIKYGTPWVYNSVPRDIFDAFDKSASKGRFINSTLNSYPYNQASSPAEMQPFQGV